MEGRYEARRVAYRDDTRLAWQIGNFAGAAFGGKLRDLDHYLPRDNPDGQPDQNGTAMFGFLMKMRQKGVPMKVERIEWLPMADHRAQAG